MSDTAARHLTDNFAPVVEEVTAFDLPVTGHIPEPLSGRLLRIGPNPVDPDANAHWFSGTGMVHGVRLDGGRAAWYRNRFVRSDRVVEARDWPPVEGPRHGMGDGTANTNVICQAGRTYAIVEGGSYPVRLTDDLETVARDDFGGTLDGSYSAHPKLHPVTGELHAVTYYWEWDHIRYVIVGTDGKVRREVKVPVGGRPMVHDCSITDSKVLLYDLPVLFDLEIAMAGRSMPYRWTPEYGARIGILGHEADPADAVWCEIEPCYVFHPLNAYDAPDGTIVADVVKHPKMFDTDSTLPGGGPPILVRWTIDPATASVTEEVVSGRPQEFPRVDERVVGRQHRFGYGVQSGDGSPFGIALKHDLTTGTTEERNPAPTRVYQEPIFVPRSDSADEDDGWVMAYVHDAATDTAQVEIWESRDFNGPAVATIHLPQRVPFGFHGNWVPDPA